MPGNPRSHPALGTGRTDLTGRGGYKRHAKEERESWDGLAAARGDWLVDDAVKWGERVLCGRMSSRDLSLGTVKLYVGALISIGRKSRS